MKAFRDHCISFPESTHLLQYQPFQENHYVLSPDIGRSCTIFGVPALYCQGTYPLPLIVNLTKSDGLKTFWLKYHGNGSICPARAKITKADILDSPMHFEASGAPRSYTTTYPGISQISLRTPLKKGMNEGSTNTTKSQNRGPVNASAAVPCPTRTGSPADSCALSSSNKIAQY